MNALSVMQPWPRAITDLGKPIENRSWPLPAWIIGKRVALHASKRPDRYGPAAIERIAGILPPADLPLGAIVATVVFTGCVTESDSPYFVGEYGWEMVEVWKLPQPVPCKGALGFWRVPADLLPKVAIKAGDPCPWCKQSTLSQRPNGHLFCAYCNLMDDVLAHYPPRRTEWENIYDATNR